MESDLTRQVRAYQQLSKKMKEAIEHSNCDSITALLKEKNDVVQQMIRHLNESVRSTLPKR